MRMLLSHLQHWWEIYAPYQAVTTTTDEKASVHPHRGQVIRYRRLMSSKTKQEVARALHWSPAYIRKIEACPDGTNDVARSFDLIPYLQISPRLLDVPEDFFLPDTPDGAHAALMETLQLLLDDMEARKDEIKSLIIEYERTRVPSYVPLLAQEKKMYDDAMTLCFVTVAQALEPMQYMKWLTSREKQIAEELGIDERGWERYGAARQHGKARSVQQERLPSSLVQREKLQEAIAWAETWQEKASRMMDQSASFRRDQLMYVKCSLYEALLYPAVLKPEIYAELGPEKSLDYLTRWLVCATFLGNVVLMAPPLLERMNFFLESDLPELALEDFHELQFCLDMMCDVFGLWSEASAYVSALDRSIDLAKSGMKVRLRSYQQRVHPIVRSKMSGMEHADLGSENDWGGQETLVK